MKRERKTNQNIWPAHSSISTIGSESGVTHTGREETQNKETQEVTSLVKMDSVLSIETENNDEEYKVQKKKGKWKKLVLVNLVLYLIQNT